MRISDWSSDVCSSDLLITRHVHRHDLKQEIDPPRDHVAGNDTAYIQHGRHERISHFLGVPLDVYAGENRQAQTHRRSGDLRTEIGMAAGRERVGQYVSFSVVAESLKKKKRKNK